MQILFSLTPQTEQYDHLIEALIQLERQLIDTDIHDESLQFLLSVGTFQAKEWETDRLLLIGDELDPSFGSVVAEKPETDSDGQMSDRVQILLNHSWLDTASVADIGALLESWISENLSVRSSTLPSDQESSKAEDNSVSRSGSSSNVLTLVSGSGGFVINGHQAGDNSGWSVAGVGDVNGDGLGDVLIGAPNANPSILTTDAGRSYVVFGKTGQASTTAVNLSAIANGIGGFVINGACSNDISGTSVAAAGDVNGDGLADLLVGAPKSDPTSGMNAGRSYVVFGKTTTTAIQLSGIAAGNGGFVINGQSSNEQTGFSVSSAGDINGDGLADMLIGAPFSDPPAGVDVGRTYVIFGKSSHLTSIPPIAPIELATLSANNGFVINGLSNTQRTGLSVASAGDVNGDGFADLIIGGVSSQMLPFVEGYAYVVYGAPNLTSVNLASITNGVGGFRIKDRWNASIGTSLGISVAGAGDVNGDGLADLMLGNPNRDRAFIVFGKTNSTSVDLTSPPSWGFVMAGSSDQAGRSVSTAGDVNGDGLADLLVGAPAADGGYGCTYVVFGKTSTTPVALDPWSFSDGIVINSQTPYDQSQTGRSVSSAGDVNGDGLADLLIGAPFSDPASTVDAGRSYVIYGATNGAFSSNVYDSIGTNGNDTIQGNTPSESFAGGLGNDTFSPMGGADVMNGGAGNDRFVLDPFALTTSFPTASALMNPLGSHPQLARIHGGTGIDSIVITSGGLNLNLNTIANQSAMNSNGSSRLTSIEVFDIRGNGLIGNALTLRSKDIDDITGFNWLNSTTAPSHNITSGTYTIPVKSGFHQLFIRGDSNDTLNVLDGTWLHQGTILQSGLPYNVFQSGARELIVRQGMVTSGL
jgi:hypothetical protein